MFGVLAGLALLALAGSSRGPRSFGDAPLLPADVDAVKAEGVEVYLLRPQDFAHPADKQKVMDRAEQEGGQWAVVPSSGWSGAKHFPTAKSARTALTAAGFKGPFGKGTSSRWSR